MTVEAFAQFCFATLLPVFTSIAFYLLSKNTPFGRWGFWQRQIVIGIVFGGIAVMGTEFGVPVHDVTMNVRDAAPLVAGLLFGGPAGVIAGLIGGVERWFAALWGRGMFTRLACSLATIAAGFYALILRRYIFNNKRPTWPLAFATGVVVEVLHLTLVFITNMNDVKTAFAVVAACTAPMLLFNGASVALSTVAVSKLDKEPAKKNPREWEISYQVQAGMLIAVLVALALTSGFMLLLQSRITRTDTQILLSTSIKDVTKEVEDASVSQRMTMSRDPERASAELASDLVDATENRHVGESGIILVADSQGRIISTSDDGAAAGDLASTGLEEAVSNASDFSMFEGSFNGERVLGMCETTNNYKIIAILPESEADYSRNVSSLLSIHMIVLVFAALFIAIYFLIKRRVVDNIQGINTTLDEIIGGDLDAVVDVHESVEFSQLSDDINQTVMALRHFIDEEAARIDAELEYARKIQRGALPRVFPPFPTHDEFDIYASMDAAKVVGGDFYDFYLLDKEHLAFLIADVSGKGIPASLFMMTTKTLIKSLAESRLPVEEVISRANDQLCQNNDADMFVTVWMAILNLTTGHMSYVNAGHNPPALCHADGSFSYVKARPNLVLASMDGIPYRRHEMTLLPGDTLFLYTDGVTEATDNNDELFGEDRLLESLDNRRDSQVDEMCAGVHKDVDVFVGAAPQFDDITVLALRYKGLE